MQQNGRFLSDAWCLSFDPAWQQPFVNVIKFCSSPSDKSKQHGTEGSVVQEMDKDVGRTVFRIKGSVPSNNYVSFPSTIPKNKGDVLGLIGQFCYFQLKVSKEVFVFHIEVMTKDELTIRFSFSNIYKQIKVCCSFFAMIVQYSVENSQLNLYSDGRSQ